MIYIVLILILVGVDQFSKYFIDGNMFEGDTIPLVTNFFHITYVKNRGIAFGLFQGKLDIISVVTIFVIVAIAYYFYREKEKLSIVEKLGFTFIISGAIGNIIDRISRGYVIDMIDFRGIWQYIFNLADVWINIGVIMIVIDQLLLKKGKNNEEDK